MLLLVSVMLVFLGLRSAREFPPYITKCKAAEIDKCGPGSANAALAGFLHGDAKFRIPNFFPLHLDDIQIDEPQLKFNLTKCQLRGFKSIDVFQTIWRRDLGVLGFIMKKLTLIGEYPAGSTINNIVFSRPGIANFTLNNVKVTLNIFTKILRVNNKETRFFPVRLYFEIDPKSSSHTFTDFSTKAPFVVVKNSKVITDLILPKFQAALQHAFLQSGGRFLKLVPAEIFFLPA